MDKITFTSGTMSKQGEYYTLCLFNSNKKVYAATLDERTAVKTLNKHSNIKII